MKSYKLNRSISIYLTVVISILLFYNSWVACETYTDKKDLSPEKIYYLYLNKIKEMDRKSAEDNLKIGKFCYKNGMIREAEGHLQEAIRINPKLIDKAQDILDEIKENRIRQLYEEAFSNYSADNLYKAKKNLETITSQYPDSKYTIDAKRLIQKIISTASRRNEEAILTPIPDNSFELQEILSSFKEPEEKDKYFSDLLKKSKILTGKVLDKNDYQKNQDYILEALKTLEVALNSDNEEIKKEAEKKRKDLIKKLFDNYCLPFTASKRDTFWSYLSQIQSEEYIEKISKEYINLGTKYAEKAEGISKNKKIEQLQVAFNCFYLSYSFFEAQENRIEAFKKMKLAQRKLRKLR